MPYRAIFILLTCFSAIPIAGGAIAAPVSCPASPTTTVEMENCNDQARAETEALLQATYDATIKALPTDQAAKLRLAERQWIAFRQADCSVFHGSQTGTLAGVEAGQCMVDRAAQRIKDLKDFIQ